jgi:cytochrome bd-type quinol oxidase subunit 2
MFSCYSSSKIFIASLVSDDYNLGKGGEVMLDRRRGPDKLVKWVKWSGIISWILVSFILIITLIAKPTFESYMDESFHIKLQDAWDTDMMQYVLLLLILLFIFCMVSIAINLMRCRRKSDRFNKTLIVNAVAAFVGIILYLIFLI